MADVEITLKRNNSGTADRLLPTTTWNQVESKPTTFTPSSHTHPFTDITGTATTSQLPTITLAKGGTGQTSFSNGGSVLYYNSQSGVISSGGAPSSNNVLMATGYNGTHYFGNWVSTSTLANQHKTSTTIASLAANTLSSSYSVVGYRFAHIWLSNTAANTTTTIWQGTIDLDDTNQRGTTTGNRRYQRIVWNNGISTFADNLEIYAASSTSIQFRHSAGITMRYRIVWEE